MNFTDGKINFVSSWREFLAGGVQDSPLVDDGLWGSKAAVGGVGSGSLSGMTLKLDLGSLA